MVFLSSSAWKWQAEPLKQQVTRWLLTHSLQRWAVLCKAHAGEQLRQHDGSISEKVREKADGGSRHHPGLNWSDLDSWIADFLGYRCASTLKSTHFWPRRPHSLSHFMFDCDPGATMSVVLDLSFSVCVWISAAVAIIYTSLGGLYSVAYTDVIQISLVLLSLVSFFFFAQWNSKLKSILLYFDSAARDFLSSQWLCVPFVLTSGVYTDITKTAFNHTHQAPWLGTLESDDVGRWIDNFLVMVRWTTVNRIDSNHQV